MTQPGRNGEYPVYYSHQDHARWRIRDTGEWHDAANETPDFPSFAEWLVWAAECLSRGEEPASGNPTAFEEMPGRAG